MYVNRENADGREACGWPAGGGHAEGVGRPEAEVRFAAELRLFLAPRHRGGQVRVACDGTSSLGHVVESLGVPLPEVGRLAVNGGPVGPAHRLSGGDMADAGAVPRPQWLPSARFRARRASGDGWRAGCGCLVSMPPTPTTLTMTRLPVFGQFAAEQIHQQPASHH